MNDIDPIKVLDRYKKMFEQARSAISEHQNKVPLKPLNDPEWQIWIRDYVHLNKRYGNAYIAFIRQAVLVKLEKEGQA